ncbi:MAG TPA: stage II sporulation protein M, partial [Longimicrobiales bacterium]|nr:stage II sporulation protein M [Longimicrobiales bacterium]
GSRQAAKLWREHHAMWRELEGLVESARRGGLEALPEEDVSRFAALYRVLAADLARTRTYGGSRELLYGLERLATSAHNLLYRPARRTWSSLKQWLGSGFPGLVRRRWRVIAVAAVALFGPAAGTWAVVVRDPGVARELLPAALVARAETAPDRLAAGQGYVDVPEVFMPIMSSSIIANNVQVTFLAFAGGILAGVGTLLLLAFNGIHLGAVAGLYHVNGAGVLLWTFVAAHGGLELGAICIAGGAGLWMGSALVFPGRATRAHALTTRARDAVSLLAGTTLLLVVAGVLEGFLSPAPVPPGLKLGAAAVVALAGLAYLLVAGRTGEEERRGGSGRNTH